MATANSDFPIGTDIPFLQVLDSTFNLIKIGSSGNGISNRGEEDVRISFLNVLNRSLDIHDFFPLVAPHKKHPGLNATRSTQCDCGLHLFDGDTRSMASNMRCDPLSEPIHRRKQPISASVSTTDALRRSAREMHSNGNFKPRRFNSPAY